MESDTSFVLLILLFVYSLRFLRFIKNLFFNNKLIRINPSL